MKRFTQYLVENPIRREGVVVVFGRFNPPTIGHEHLFRVAQHYNPRYDFKIFVSHSQDPKKNPLQYDEKIAYLKAIYPEFSNYIQKDEFQTIFKVLESLQYEYENLIFIVGADRAETFKNAINSQLATNLSKFKSAEVPALTSLARDPDSDSVSGMSASKMREAVMDGDYDAFKSGLPPHTPEDVVKSLFGAIKKGMQPKIKADLKKTKLREDFFSGRLFAVGEKVKTISSSIVGRIDYIGSNYVIVECDERHTKTRHWITDIEKEDQ